MGSVLGMRVVNQGEFSMTKLKQGKTGWSRRGKQWMSAPAAAAVLAVCGIGAAAPVDAAGTGMVVQALSGITVEAERPDWEEKLSPGTVTVIEPQTLKGEQKTLPDMLRTVPGIHVRELNGKGQYTTVTVRGSTAAQVGVFMDGILTNLGGDAAVDISTIPVKNVERIEVYRGYIPARFGGTFIGGVINIVTKKPDKPGISAEIGKSSFGGKSFSLEYTAPLGSGTLMAAGNYESSDGDFPYENYAAERYIPRLEEWKSGAQDWVDNFNSIKIDELTTGGATDTPLIRLSPEQIDHFKADEGDWLNFVRGSGADSLSGYMKESAYDNGMKTIEMQDEFVPTIAETVIAGGMTIREAYINIDGLNDDPNSRNYWVKTASVDWRSNGGYIGQTNVKETLVHQYVDKTIDGTIENTKNEADPTTSKTLEGKKSEVERYKKALKEARDARRWRKYNDYKNSSAMLKWQNPNWMVKGAWNKIDRHLPDGLWGGDSNTAIQNFPVDLRDMYWFDSRRQTLDNTELMVQNRNQNGRLEWGWSADYLIQHKKYRAEHIMSGQSTDFEVNNVPLREWSKYNSNKYNIQVDGTYKVSDRNMLDFQANYSHERLNVDGSLMDKVLGDSDLANILGQTRNRYEQNIFNVQLQDTITLDRGGTLHFTPSLRYNRSTIVGYSDGKRFADVQDKMFHWLNPRDSQTDGKVTWQLALKKEFNDHFTMRVTGGTYYRLLNMYEIAGDGAGILPAPNDNGRDAAFPLPEEGKQFDVSALWQGTLLRARNSTTLTYFWRDTENMLQLTRLGKDYWSYLNDNKGKAHGFEFQSNFSWNKVDLDLRATYLKTRLQRKNSAVNYDYTDVWPTYQPEWEGNVRLTYRPNSKVDIFGEVHYTDEYFTSYSRDSRGGEYAYLSGRPVSALTTVNGGIKWKPSPSWQFAIGCNDIFNKGPKLKIKTHTATFPVGYINPEFPIQGRTYYATIRYQF